MANDYLRVLSVDNPADALKLARKAKRVKNVQSTEVILGIQRMKRAAVAWEHETGRRCEGLAAPQIGWNARVIILRASDAQEPKNPRGFTPSEWEAIFAEKNPYTYTAEEAAEKYGLDDSLPIGSPENYEAGQKLFADMQAWNEAVRKIVSAYDQWKYRVNGFFDPWLVMINPTVKQAEGDKKSVEGCLSVPHGGYEVLRPTHIAFKYLSPNCKASGVHLAKGDNAIKLAHELDHLKGKTINQHGTVIIGAGGEKL